MDNEFDAFVAAAMKLHDLEMQIQYGIEDRAIFQQYEAARDKFLRAGQAYKANIVAELADG